MNFVTPVLMEDKIKYVGVQYKKYTLNYEAKVAYQGIVYNCGRHETKRQAAVARDRKILEKNLPHKLQVLKPKK